MASMQALAYAAPTPDQLDRRIAEVGYYEPDRLLTGAELLALLWGRP